MLGLLDKSETIGDTMFFTEGIIGIKELEKKLPEELQSWHRFGNIEELHYRHIWSCEDSRYINFIEMILTDFNNKYAIKMSLYNVTGLMNFDLLNGFYTGFTIEDCSDMGYEKENRFRLSSLEQDIDLAIYCEKIEVELQ